MAQESWHVQDGTFELIRGRTKAQSIDLFNHICFARTSPILKMLDPLTALGVVSSVIQIVDFGCKLVSETQEIYQSASGATRKHVTSLEITEDINILYKDLLGQNQSFPKLSPDDIALEKLVDSCSREAEELIKLLGKLKVPSDATQWESFKKAIKSKRKQGEVKDIETRLLKIQKQINSRLQMMMTYVSLDLLGSTNASTLATNNLHY